MSSSPLLVLHISMTKRMPLFGMNSMVLKSLSFYPQQGGSPGLLSTLHDDGWLFWGLVFGP